MSNLSAIHTHAPYERVCIACGHVRAAVEYSGRRRTCDRCLHARLAGIAPSGSSDHKPHYPIYDGAELRPFTGRPGAMDAFALPSLRFGKRVYRRDVDLISTTSKEQP